MKSITIALVYDEDTDAGYIYLDEIAPGDITEYHLAERLNIQGSDVALDFDKVHRLKGIEVGGASKILSDEYSLGLPKE